MEEMRVQIEAREPTDGEIRAFWFTLPIDTEQVEELLGIDIDTDYYYITGKELPFADEVQEDTTIEKLDDLYHTYESLPSDLKEDYGELMCYFTDLDELHRYRNDIIHYSWCKNMTDVPKVSAHVMRHTACTRMAECRMDIKVLQYIMGHAHFDVTMEVYNHLGDRARIENEIAKLDSMAVNF